MRVGDTLFGVRVGDTYEFSPKNGQAFEYSAGKAGTWLGWNVGVTGSFQEREGHRTRSHSDDGIIDTRFFGILTVFDSCAWSPSI